MSDFKSCPFCGSNDIEILHREKPYPTKWRYHSICNRCGAEGEVGFSKEDATEKWNSRPTDPKTLIYEGLKSFEKKVPDGKIITLREQVANRMAANIHIWPNFIMVADIVLDALLEVCTPEGEEGE